MSNDLVKAEDVLLNSINKICCKFGLNNIMAQLYAVLYLSAKPLSLDDMVERLKISKGSASINIRALERYGVVRRAWVNGSRKDYYEAESDISKVIVDRVQSMMRMRLSELDSMINSSYEVLSRVASKSEAEEDSVKFFKDRLQKLKDIYNQAQVIFDIFSSSSVNNNLFSLSSISEKPEPSKESGLESLKRT